MPTPYVIQNAGPIVSGQQAQECGPFYYNGEIYATVCDFDQVDNRIGVFRADNPQGTTWTKLDASNSPFFIACSAYYLEGDSQVYYAYSDPGSLELHLAKFDFATETYSIIATGGPQADGKVLYPIQLVVLPNGNFVVAYANEDVPFIQSSYVVEYNGSWGFPILVKSGVGDAGSEPCACALGNGNVAHFLRYDGYAFPTPDQLNHFSYTTGGSVSSDTLVDSGNLNNGFRISGPGFYFPGDDEVVFPYAPVNGVSFMGTIHLSPSASPSVTINLVPGADYWDDSGAPRLAIEDGELKYLSIIGVVGFGPGIMQVGRSSWNGTSWDTVEVFWDSDVDPVPGFTFPESKMLSTRISPDGAYGIVSGIFDEDICALALWLSQNCITIACPVGGGTGKIGVPYNKTLVVVGGIPPFTFAITSGALPPGLTLNTTTGVISGTPTTNGTYFYTVTVTGS